MTSKRYFRYFTYIEPVIKAPIIKTYGSLIFTILMIIVFIVFAIKPTLETIFVLQKELTVQKETLAKIDKKTESISKARTNYQNLELALLDKLQVAVPDNIQIARLVTSLEGTALNTQASISALQFQPLTIQNDATGGAQTRIQEIEFTFNIEGSYSDLKQVLQNLSASPRLVSIDNLTFTKTTINTLVMSISGKAYYLE